VAEAGPAQRLLVYFPIIHTEADMGALGESMQRLTVGRWGRRSYARSVQRIEELWSEIERAIAGLKLNRQGARVYQDGLPECGRELEIVAELARAGSRNHKLLLQLQQRGAVIMGTESADLLMAEYEFVKETLAARSHREATRMEARQKAARDALLSKRDGYIAARINSTLASGETGLLFLGALHAVAPLLEPDIRVVYPLLRPAGRTERPRA
jgi:hypothetical protein